MDYRETLHLPKTNFPMRANLAKREPNFVEKWNEPNIYHKIRELRQGNPLFVLHDGPPYANGGIHLGTGLNKILKDMVVKSKILLGYNIHYRPGWDCHGLPIELNVTQEMNKGKNQSPTEKLEALELRKKCTEYALSFVEKHRISFKRLGIIGEWERPYLTLNPKYEAEELRQFAHFVKKGYVYQGLKPVYWDSYLQTALAEAEVEYDEHTSSSIFVRFPVREESLERIKKNVEELEKNKNVNIIIWTTTPWTLPANRAVCLHPNYMYTFIPLENEYVLVAKDLVSRFLEETGLQATGKPIGTFTGQELVNMEVVLKPPFSDDSVPLICGTHVTLEQGTGAVHTAPGHGHEDYLIGLEYNLEVFSPVDEAGKFTEQSPVCQSMHVEDANDVILEKLQENHLLVHHEKYTHSYPHCWRSKKPIIFRATQQWFISLEQDNLRETLLQEIDNVKWIPSWGRQRIRGMVENRQEWCISRQRTWGVPIPAIYIQGQEKAIIDAEFIYEVADIVEKEGSDFWFRALQNKNELKRVKRLNDILPEGTNLEDITLEPDILDVWFDSGVSHHAVMANDEELYPVDMYLEGSDQHRGWFQSSLVTAVGAGYGTPYQSVLTHGFTVDEKGRKLSKSLGNFVLLDDLLKTTGADIIRLWVAAEDFRGDVTYSNEILKRITESYRRIRNTARFLLGNLNKYEPSEWIKVDERLSLDRWIMYRWYECKKRIIESYERYDFHRIFYDLNNFCSVDLSAIYLDIIKDRLYCSSTHSLERKSAQSTLADIVVELTACSAPILSFTSEEIWTLLHEMNLVQEESVFYFALDKKVPPVDKDLMHQWEKRFLLRGEVIRSIETARKEGVIGHPLDCCVLLETSNEEWKQTIQDMLHESLGNDLTSVCIVSQAHLGTVETDNQYKSTVIPGLTIGVQKALGEKCPRCWHYHEKVNTDGFEVCPRCKDVLEKDQHVTT